MGSTKKGTRQNLKSVCVRLGGGGGGEGSGGGGGGGGGGIAKCSFSSSLRLIFQTSLCLWPLCKSWPTRLLDLLLMLASVMKQKKLRAFGGSQTTTAAVSAHRKRGFSSDTK